MEHINEFSAILFSFRRANPDVRYDLWRRLGAFGFIFLLMCALSIFLLYFILSFVLLFSLWNRKECTRFLYILSIHTWMYTWSWAHKYSAIAFETSIYFSCSIFLLFNINFIWLWNLREWFTIGIYLMKWRKINSFNIFSSLYMYFNLFIIIKKKKVLFDNL